MCQMCFFSRIWWVFNSYHSLLCCCPYCLCPSNMCFFPTVNINVVSQVCSAQLKLCGKPHNDKYLPALKMLFSTWLWPLTWSFFKRGLQKEENFTHNYSFILILDCHHWLQGKTFLGILTGSNIQKPSNCSCFLGCFAHWEPSSQPRCFS